ncbi:nucleotide-binding universal stress UspA family protein [Aquimarina sp. MAR_2010_214]|uniref:universal stress protein n=1 Tax=Aquimarina sp. MAR_2010_214 TaxID=1250026 RepID=UPI000C70D433|nr:universal stress protein [Aquimarina sp. MAR_2010_214]PKV48286.1 nucleotide-binding universal stress UspA family protein [Aquimarina sp. MAR_2010_214]
MRKILIPTDFSENAMNALRYAVELFKYERCDFFLLHAYADEVYDHDTVVSREVFNELKQKVHKNSDVVLEKMLSEIKNISPNPRHEFKLLSMFGSLIDEANDLVDKENLDILIMGTRGETDDRKLTFGSNTLQVLKYVKCPLLVIPSGCSYSPPKNILFPTDYQLPFKRRELKLLSTLTKSFRSVINFLYISDFDKLSIRQEDNKHFLKQSLPTAELIFHQKASEDLTDGINQFIKSNEIDFLVMINSRRSYLESLLHQSTIDKIGLHIKIPFLAMQNLQRY